MKMSMRKAYGESLVALGAENPRIVALEADLGKSTMSVLFGQQYPERYFQMGIAEQNMTSVAAGLALTGYIPFVSSFAVFASGRPYDQIRSSVCIAHLNVKICGSSAGLSDFGDGKTHQSVDDIALMRVLPGMTVLSPADAVETEKMMKAMAACDGPCYLRVNRNDLETVTDPDDEYHIGKMTCLKEGADVTVFATGVMVGQALEAAKLLAAENLSVSVVNVSTIKPLDAEAVKRYAGGKRCVVTAEEASIYGGLGSAICEALAQEAVPVGVLGIRDSFGTSASNYEELLKYYHLMPEDIAAKIRATLPKA